MVKNLPASVGDVKRPGLILGLGRSPGARHGNPLQCSPVFHSRIPRTEEPGVTTGSQRVEHDQTTYHTAQKHATIPSLKIKNNIYGDRVPQ